MLSLTVSSLSFFAAPAAERKLEELQGDFRAIEDFALPFHAHRWHLPPPTNLAICSLDGDRYGATHQI